VTTEALDDPRRRDPPLAAGEREMLDAWLDFHRTTLLLKCEGLAPDDLRRRPLPPSTMSLHGLVRHLADVERHWFQRMLRDSPRDPRPLYWRRDAPDADWDELDDADWEADLAAWQAEVEASRRTAAEFDLDHLGAAPWGGEHRVSLRWILVHMIEEYARHNGHADLLREAIDGAVGD
jgi:uncharacterized damage-inducible protein DinB